ncbi:MAG: ATP-binding cassette domain-containing protein [Rickettsiaceae bacterium]
MTKNAIFIKDLVKEYSHSKAVTVKPAIDELNLAVPEGAIFGLLGPNGAGKSTLINILAGTVVKTSGEVFIDGVSIQEQPKKTSSLIGIVPQDISYDTFFPLYQALEFYAGYYGVRPEKRKTEEILKKLSLWDKKDKFPQQLSGGMKRRFLIAKAMVHSPKVLILDEPTAGVDLELRLQLWEYVRELNQQGITIIITTHYLAEAEELCNEIAFINKGKIINQSSKTELLKQFGTSYLDVEFYQPIKINDNISSLMEVISSNKARFKVDIQNANYSQILAEIATIGLSIKHLSVSEPDLEEIFHTMMQK